MINRYEKVIRDNNPEEIKKLLMEYHAAFRKIQEVDEQELFDNEFWIDKNTPIGLFLAMTIDEYVS